MMVEVIRDNVESAIKILNRRLKSDGLDRALKLRRVAKKSDRRKLKALLAARRKKKNEARREGRREVN
jgi:ribosomal protein S21